MTARAAARRPADAAGIRALLGAPVEVEAEGLALELRQPAASAALALRESLFERARAGDPGGGYLLDASAEAARACLGLDLDEEEGRRLVIRCGGESGRLARESLKLCGLAALLPAEPEPSEPGPDAEGEGSDPTPFS